MKCWVPFPVSRGIWWAASGNGGAGGSSARLIFRPQASNSCCAEPFLSGIGWAGVE